MAEFLSMLKYDKDGLIPVVAQDAETGEVLMLAYMNKEAVERTLKEGRACYWSRLRKEFWVKGETSGHVQTVKEIRVDCDRDTLLLKIDQKGGACHEGYRTCFFRRVEKDGTETIAEKKLYEKH